MDLIKGVKRPRISLLVTQTSKDFLRLEHGALNTEFTYLGIYDCLGSAGFQVKLSSAYSEGCTDSGVGQVTIKSPLEH